MAYTRKILTLNAISKKGLARLPHDYVVGNDVAEPDAILVRSQVMHDMPIADSVLAIGRAGAGTNNIPVPAMSARGVVVFNAPGANANAVKELVIAGMLMGARNLAPAIRFVAGLEGDDAALHKQVEAGKKHFVGHELPGRTLVDAFEAADRMHRLGEVLEQQLDVIHHRVKHAAVGGEF